MKIRTILFSLFMGITTATGLVAIGGNIPIAQAMQIARQLVESEQNIDTQNINKVIAAIAPQLRQKARRNQINENIVYETVHQAIIEFKFRTTHTSEEEALEDAFAASITQQEEDDFKHVLEESKQSAENNSSAHSHESARNSEHKDDDDNNNEEELEQTPSEENKEKEKDQELAKLAQEAVDKKLALQMAREEHDQAKKNQQRPAEPQNASNNEAMELALALKAINEEYEKQDPVYGAIMTLPSGLENLPLVQIKSVQQNEDITCGSRATINAWAIQTLVNEGKPLTAQTIHDKAQEKTKPYCRSPTRGY